MASDNENDKGFGIAEIAGGGAIGTAGAYGAAAAYGASQFSEKALEKKVDHLFEKDLEAKKAAMEEFQKQKPQPVFDTKKFLQEYPDKILLATPEGEAQVFEEARQAQRDLLEPWFAEAKQFITQHPAVKALEDEAEKLAPFAEHAAKYHEAKALAKPIEALKNMHGGWKAAVLGTGVVIAAGAGYAINSMRGGDKKSHGERLEQQRATSAAAGKEPTP